MVPKQKRRTTCVIFIPVRFGEQAHHAPGNKKCSFQEHFCSICGERGITFSDPGGGGRQPSQCPFASLTIIFVFPRLAKQAWQRFQTKMPANAGHCFIAEREGLLLVIPEVGDVKSNRSAALRASFLFPSALVSKLTTLPEIKNAPFRSTSVLFAEREGFEPPDLLGQRFSRPPH
jgi:hypothetical protein